MQRKRFHLLKAYSKIIKQRQAQRQEDPMGPEQEPTKHAEERMRHIEKQGQDRMEEEYTEELEHEDEFQDQYQDEQAWISAESGEEIEAQDQAKDIYLGTNKELKKGEMLEFDNEAYDMLHRLTPEWPSLSIDIITTDSPFVRPPFSILQYPCEVYTVQGSCTNSNDNSIYITKLYNLQRTKYDDLPSEMGGQETEDAQVVIQEVATGTDVRRIRALNHSPIVAYWSDGGHVQVMDLGPKMVRLQNNVRSKKKEHVESTVIDVGSEGWGLCWNPSEVGQLLVGSEDGTLGLYTSAQGKWALASAYNYHKGSVEDVVCSPQQSFVFATCSTDRTLQIVDARVPHRPQICLRAHTSDVNVCDWNPVAQHLLVTGSDDCSVKIWDLRMEDELMTLKWHNEPITSVKFQPNDESTLAVASEDNRLSLWDLSAENEEKDVNIPNELMFVHQGQEEIKQICFHPVYFEMIISSALDSIALFKPALQPPEHFEEENQIREEPIHEEQLDHYINKMNTQ